MRLRKRKPLAQLWVHYNQVGGWWGCRISDGITTVWGSGHDHYRTEFEAIDAAEDDFIRHFPDVALPEPRIFRTGADYHYAVIREGQWWRKVGQ